MKDGLVAALTAGVLLAAPAAGAADGASTERWAFASWLEPTQRADRFNWYFAVGSHDVHYGGAETVVAAIGRGSCLRTRSEESISISCGGRSSAIARGLPAFSMDNLASKARADVRQRRDHHWAQWDPKDDATHDGLYTSELSCDIGGGGGGGLLRFTRATGVLFNRSLAPHRWWDTSVMLSGAFLEVCPTARGFLEDALDGRRVTLTLSR